MDHIESRIAADLEQIRKRKTEVLDEQVRLEAERARLDEQERGMAVALKYYRTKGTGLDEPLPQASDAAPASIAALTIASAAAEVLRARQNVWATTREIEKAFQAGGKNTTYGAIDLTLKESDLFERRKEGGKNHFRLKPDVRQA